jgi:L-cysteine:1D-myo-inositol 2-amino-2-deoxy-alpha-D-glucopyranoside ligase
MKSWSAVYLPPALPGIIHKPLTLKDSYSGNLVPLEQNSINSYICGITPYDATHLGHAATYLTFDLIHRYIKASGKSLQFTENITDIDDPLLERAKRDNQDWKDLATSQISLFRDDMTALRVIPPNSYLGVVESMELITKRITELVDTGLCYEIQGDYYLSISKLEGALENLPCSLDQALSIFSERGGDPERIGKEHPLDTLIWLKARPGEPAWPSQLGSGRPGWHIECVALALETLSKTAEPTSITLQGGGSDLRFPHHYMTGVQARAITNKPFASVYSHAGMIEWQGEKMSKSKGNLVFVSKLLEAGWRGEEIRLALINRNYTEDFEWKESFLHKARTDLSRIAAALAREEVAQTSSYVQQMVDAIANNLEVTKAFAAIDNWCEATEKGEIGGNSGEMARALDLYLGIAL